jgi:hypothetical protein
VDELWRPAGSDPRRPGLELQAEGNGEASDQARWRVTHGESVVAWGPPIRAYLRESGPAAVGLTEADSEVTGRMEGSGGVLSAVGFCYTDGRAEGIGGEWKKKVQQDRGRAETEGGPGAAPARDSIDRADALGRRIMRIFPR